MNLRNMIHVCRMFLCRYIYKTMFCCTHHVLINTKYFYSTLLSAISCLKLFDAHVDNSNTSFNNSSFVRKLYKEATLFLLNRR